MGQRGVDREPATAEDLSLMRKLAAEAVRAGALGFASSRLTLHKTSGGQPIPSYDVDYAEIEAIARGVDDAGGGLLQFVPDLMAGDYEASLGAVFDVAGEVGLPVTFTLAIGNAGAPIHLDALTMVEKANADGGDVTGRSSRGPIGLMLGLDLSGNPFVMYPSYQEIADLPLAERVAEMRKPEVRERILTDTPEQRRAPADVRRAGVGLHVPARRPAELRTRPRRIRSAHGPVRAGSVRWRRPTTVCSTTTDTPCCWSPWPTSATTRWTPSPS